jgi:ribA/ribD-fused uncharacterized protein
LFYRANGDYGSCSNLYRRKMLFDGRKFRCAEEAYRFGKHAKPTVAEWLVSAPAPHLCAAAAHALLSFEIRFGWKKIKMPRMREVQVAKFTQHPELLATGHAELVDDSKTDAFWGIGRKALPFCRHPNSAHWHPTEGIVRA